MTLTVENASFGYAGRPPLLTDISLSVPAGKLLAVLGPNGAGKTTLLRCLLGLLRWRTGRTCLDGEDIAGIPSAERWQRFAFVPQARNAVSLSVSGLEMVTIGRASHLGPFAQPSATDRALAEHIMGEIGIGGLRDIACGEMSGGQFQMVLIARALAAQPRVLVLDEPETGLDFRNQLIVLDLLDRLVHERELTVVMNTHYPTHALRVADQVLLLARDRRPLYGGTDAVVTPDALGDAFGVHVELVETDIDGAAYRSVLPISLR